MSEHDLDSLYKSASESHGAGPSAAVRDAILEHARRLADQAHAKAPAADRLLRTAERGPSAAEAPSRGSRWGARWARRRWQFAVPLTAAALALIILQPQLRSTLPQSRLQQAAPSAPVALNAPQPPAAEPARAPEPFPAESELAASKSSSVPTAPPLPAAAPALPPNAAPSAAAAAPNANMANADVAAAPSVSPAARMRARPSLAAPAQQPALEAQQTEASGAVSGSQVDPLHEAAAQGDVARVRSLLQQHAALIDGRDADGRTALLLAVLQRHEPVVRELLQQGADPNIGDAAGHTPLSAARRQHSPAIVDALLQAGAR
jgi:hypothetical protein